MKNPNKKSDNVKQKTTEPKPETSEPTKPDWKIGGWLNRNKKGNSVIVSGVDDETSETFVMGFVNPKTLERFINGEINGCPIKIPPETPIPPE